MKLRNLFFALAATVATGAMAQRDCSFFFLNQEGQQATRNYYTDGDFAMSMTHLASFSEALDMMNSDVYMMGDLMNYPNVFSDPNNPADDDDFDDGTTVLRFLSPTVNL